MQIPLSSPDITQAERDALERVLRTRYLALGPRLREFEERLAAFHGRRHAVAVNSGTSALHLAMLALDVQPGDEVITTPFSFIASANCILYVNGTVRFVDIDTDTWNLDPCHLAQALSPRTKGILPVHVFGVPCDMEWVTAFAAKHGLWVVEDACEAIGARSGGRMVGRQADISVLAFYPNKQITTGEGGVLLTDDADKAALCRSLRNQGRSESGGWLAHERLGYNYRMDELAAALGVVQLKRLPEILEKRARVAGHYKKRLSACPHLRFQAAPPGAEPSWFVFVVALAPRFSRAQRDRVLDQLRGRGIGCSNYFPPIHLQPCMRARYSFEPGAFPVCESLAERTIALPFHSNLSPAEVEVVAAALLEIVEQLEPAAASAAGGRDSAAL